MNEKFISLLTFKGIKKPFDKKKIIQILFLSALLLLAGNFLAGKLITGITSGNKKEISLDAADKKFKLSLSQLGIDERLIKLKKKKSDSEPNDYKITIPADLAIPLILVELKNNFADESVEIVFNEKTIGGKTFIKLSQHDNLLLKAEMDYDKTLLRAGGYIAFILEGFDELDEQSITALLKAPELFGILLTPSKKNLKFADSLSNYRKEVVVLLNDDINELDYKLAENYSENRLKKSIEAIIKGFKKSVCIVIDENSDLNNSSVKPLLAKEFEARKILFMNKNLIYSPVGSSIEEKLKSFDEMLDKTKNNLSKAVLVDADEFLSYMPEIIRYRKIGYKFVNPSEVLRKLPE